MPAPASRCIVAAAAAPCLCVCLVPASAVAAGADCPAGVWEVHRSDGSGEVFDEVDVCFSVTFIDSYLPMAFLPPITLSAADAGTTISFGPEEPAFAAFAAALTNGEDDLLRVTTFYTGGGDSLQVFESAAFGGAGGPDLAWTQAGEIRIVVNDIDFVAACAGCPTSYVSDIEFQVLPACPADVDGDQIVDVSDLLDVIMHWGVCSPDEPCPADVSCDGEVGAADLIEIISRWGACPSS